MNLEKVIFGFFIIFACTLNFARGTVSWVLTGSEPPGGLVFRWWHNRLRHD